jgi:hypothetical protein
MENVWQALLPVFNGCGTDSSANVVAILQKQSGKTAAFLN